jgi:hypothetical protein
VSSPIYRVAETHEAQGRGRAARGGSDGRLAELLQDVVDGHLHALNTHRDDTTAMIMMMIMGKCCCC